MTEFKETLEMNKATFFPLLIMYTDTQETKVVSSPELIENQRTFKVLKTGYSG
jgi:hypothetical protein